MKHKKKIVGATAAGILAAATALVAPWEGYFGRTYIDPVGVPTLCYGETRKDLVAEGRKRTFTKAECLAMLQERLPEYDIGFKQCITREIPASVHIAMISATYNIGVAGMCRSTMVRKINQGDFRAACDALLMWNRGGGRVLKGLDNRRRAERKVCLEGL